MHNIRAEMQVTTYVLPYEMNIRLHVQAMKERRTKSEILRQLIAEYLARKEDNGHVEKSADK